MKNMDSNEFHDTVRKGLKEVSQRLTNGELDGSGRFYTDEELARGAATGECPLPEKHPEEPAA